MDRLINPILRELFLLHQQDDVFLRLILELQESLLVIDNFENFERDRIALGHRAATPQQILNNKMAMFRRMKGNVFRIMRLMILNQYNTDRAQVLFEQLFDNYLEDYFQNLGLPNGNEIIREFHEQPAIRAPPVMVNPFVHQHFHQHAQQRAQVEAQRDVQFRLAPAVPAPELDDMTDEQIFAVAEDYNSRLTCPVCMTNKVNTVLMPCGHLICSTCAPRLTTENGGNNRCPRCNLGFRTMHNIYYKKYLKYKNKYLALKRDI